MNRRTWFRTRRVSDTRSQVNGPTTDRRGFALLATMWLSVAIASVALAFAMESKQTVQTATNRAQLAQARAIARAGVATTLSRLDQLSAGLATNTRYSIDTQDPWQWADSLASGNMELDGFRSDVRVRDVGAMLDINTATETQWRDFFSALQVPYTQADQLAQRIVDWREASEFERVSGAKRPEYLSAGAMVLPSGRSFSDVQELRHVMGMTPELFQLIEPYLTSTPTDQQQITTGEQTVTVTSTTLIPINVNTAPVPVLRTLSGMTDDMITTILSMRSTGTRITSFGDLISDGGGRRAQVLQQRLQGRVTFTTSQVEITCVGYGRDGRARVTSTVRATRGNPTLQVDWRRER